MYAVSDLWTSLLAASSHRFETRVDISGVAYYQDTIISVSVNVTPFSEQHPGVGGSLSGELELVMLKPSASIPRMAEVRPYVRVTDGTQYSEWVPQGVFFIDTRETTRNDDGLDVLTIHAYDAMLKTEADYPPTTHAWPARDTAVVQEIANTIGVGVDARTWDVMTGNYSINTPAGYSMREVLSNIAAMYAGNWIMNYDGDLRLIGLAELPEETNYLIDQAYDAITFGGDRILV